MSVKLDCTDIRILGILQVNANLSVSDIARKVGLTVTPCWRRIQRLEETGVIKRRVAMLDPEKLGLGISVFVSIRTNQHSAEWAKNFNEAVSAMPEVMEIYRMSGDVDYLLRVQVGSMEQYDVFYNKLISKVNLSDVSSSFAMQKIKFTVALPLPGPEGAGNAENAANANSGAAATARKSGA